MKKCLTLSQNSILFIQDEINTNKDIKMKNNNKSILNILEYDAISAVAEDAARAARAAWITAWIAAWAAAWAAGDAGATAGDIRAARDARTSANNAARIAFKN